MGSLVRMENSIRPPTLDLTPISQEQIDHSALLFEARQLSDRLAPYPNNSTMFHPRLQKYQADDRNLAIFGRVPGGLFFVDLMDGSVGLLPIDGGTPLKYCNSDLGSFAIFHNALMEAIQAAINSHRDVSECTLLELETAFRKSDPSSMLDESNFWPTCLYELSEGFFPLSSEKVELHRSLGVDLSYPW
ncbi:hypothetical protein ABH900_000470 [Stenotrophomonas sp. AN71]|uniref:SUKH-4 family immunity protein n=1 Tax=Stenotrophomonas sp. AN71 TaxID=3156253 RepID=UPI003D1E6A61